jgi:hypothetical protein
MQMFYSSRCYLPCTAIHLRSPICKSYRSSSSAICVNRPRPKSFKVTPANPLRTREKRKIHQNPLLDRIFTGPFSSSCLVSGTVGLVDVCDLRNQWVIGIRVGQHGADRQQNYRTLALFNLSIYRIRHTF